MVESGAFFGRKTPSLTLEQIRVIVQTAHALGVLVSAHITNSNDLEKALAGNVDDIAHLAEDLIPDELIQQMVHRGIYLEPTLELWKEGERVFGIESFAMSNLKNYISAGGKVALGTDYAGHPQFNFEVGIPMKEILWMNEAGMTPLEIITACTRNAAYVCNLNSVIGTLEIGKKADILVVDGNPLEDLQVLKRNKLVIHDGKVIREFQ
jgi:imidazolonepropionase-like amidohydrolase